jgi:putative transposase
MIPEPGPHVPELFDTVLADARIEVVLSGVQITTMNSTMGWWVPICRRELLDQTLIWNRPPAPRSARLRTLL